MAESGNSTSCQTLLFHTISLYGYQEDYRNDDKGDIIETDLTLQLISVIISYIPISLLISTLLLLMIRKRTFSRCLSLFSGLLITALVVIVWFSFPQDRPWRSCLLGRGMPSLHSALSMGILVLWCYNTLFHGADQCMKVMEVGLWTALLLPVPFARLLDHTLLQCFVGTLIGILISTLLIVALKLFIKKKSLDKFLSKLNIENDWYCNRNKKKINCNSTSTNCTNNSNKYEMKNRSSQSSSDYESESSSEYDDDYNNRVVWAYDNSTNTMVIIPQNDTTNNTNSVGNYITSYLAQEK